MYIWKCWRDTRWFFLVFVAIAASVMPFAAFANKGGPAIRSFGAMALAETFATIVAAAAYAMGTITAIQEFTDKTAHFLFTKPRSRAYFVWASWIVGFGELMIIASVNLLSGWCVLAHYGGSPLEDFPLHPINAQSYVGPLIYAIFAYALTYSFTILFRNGLKGLGASLGVMAGFVGIADALDMRWHIQLPRPPGQIGGLPLAASNVIWIIVALLLIYGAALALERAEI